jgi:hypothetical protein
MSTKKRILRTMALIGLAVFVVSAGALAITTVLMEKARTRSVTAQAEKREALVRKYRAFLNETAKKIVKLPVDPNVAGQAQARYFEEYPNARLYLWAMDTQGQFQFGAPAEAFARLNRAYDTYQEAIEQEGRFADRQDFIRRLVQDHNELDFARYETKDAEKGPASKPVSWRGWEGHDDEGLVFSAPFQNERGEMLGNLYLKVAGIDQHPYYFGRDYDPQMTISGILAVASFVFLWFLLPSWVYLDAKARGVRTPVRWSVLTFVSLVFGLAVYLILRPEAARTDTCQNCGRATDGGRFCPFCGAPAINEFCPKCGYPVRPEWAYCPSCQSPARKTPGPVIIEGERPAAATESPAK